MLFLSAVIVTDLQLNWTCWYYVWQSLYGFVSQNTLAWTLFACHFATCRL